MGRTWSMNLAVALWLGGCSGDDVVDPRTGVHTGTPTNTTLAPVQVTEGGVVTCADPTLREGGRFDRRQSATPPNSDLWIWAGGEMAGDFDGDGWLDVMTPNELGVELYEGTGDGFISRGQQVLGDLDLSFGTGGSVVDYDADGDLDVYVTRFRGDPGPDEPGMGKNRLLRNDGGGVFTDVTDAAGVDGCGFDANTGSTGCYRTMSSSWADMDGDGDLDLFVGNYGWVDESGTSQNEFLPAEPSFLYRNDGDGTFTDVSERMPQKLRDGYTYAGGFFDLDDDGDVDIYTVNDFGNKWPNHVLLNNGDGTFVDDEPSNGTGLNIATTGMGLAVGDYNGDGTMDLAVPKWNGNHLLMSSAVGWIDYADQAGFTVADPQKVGWGALAADMDNDGLLDIVQQYGHVANENPTWRNGRQQPDAMYRNVGTAQQPLFVDVGEEWGIADPGVSRGVVVADFNRDGWLDIGKRDLAGPNVVYLSYCGEDHWLRVHLQQPGTMNLDAIGARVTVEAGDLVLTQWLAAGGMGYGTGNPPELHFGLGAADTVDRITVRWPDGTESVVRDLASSQGVTLTR